MPAPFATLADVLARHPQDAASLCASEDTREPEWARFDAALEDVSTEVRVILQARYTPAQIDDLDAASLGALKLYAIDMAMYRVSLAFGRQTEEIRARYDLAVKRLEGIASAKAGGLTFATPAPLDAGGGAAAGGAAASPGGVLIDAPPRRFKTSGAA